MAITFDGALALGPDVDDTRYYSMALPSTPAGDFAIFFAVKLSHLYTGDPQSVGSSVIRLAANYQAGLPAGTPGTGGAESHFLLYPQNHSTTGSRLTLATRMVSGATNITSGGPTATTVKVTPHDTVFVCVQSVGGFIEFWMCGQDGTPVLLNGTAQARTAGFGIKPMGTWYIGSGGNANTMQYFGMANQAFTSTQIAQLALGTLDLEDAVTSANRAALWLLNSTAATIPATWGATAATRVGSFTNNIVASPVIPNAPVRIRCTNAPLSYAAVAVKDDGTAPTKTWTGTYTGFTPTAMQGRLITVDGQVAQDWADLGSFTASSGNWSGTMTIPAGGLYRLQIRDKTDQTIIWRGASAWLCAPIHLSIGQSPHSIFELNGREQAVTPVAGLMRVGWLHPLRATQTTASTGQAKALNAIAAASGGRGAFLIGASVTGTSSTQWAAKDALVWPDMLAELDVVKPERLLVSWLNGAADTALAANGTATIKANHDQILANLDADLTTTRGIAYRYRMLPHQRDTGNVASNGAVRVAQYEWARDHALAGSKVLIGAWWPDAQTDVESTGTARGGTSTTITLAADDMVVAGSGSLTDAPIAIIGGTGAGQTNACFTLNATTKVLTVRNAWTTIPDATSVYKIYGGSPHQNQDIRVERYGTRYGQDIAARFGYSTVTGRGPIPLSAAFPSGGDGTIIDVTFQHRHGTNLRTPNGGTTATGVAGFTVDEGTTGTTRTLASQVITGPNTVRLTLSGAAPTDKTKVRVRYGHYEPVAATNFATVGGVGGLGDLLYDDTAIAPTDGLPAYFTTADLVPTDGAAAVRQLNVGAASPTALYVGGQAVTAVYHGAIKVWGG